MNDKLKGFEDCQWLSHAEFVDKDSVRISIIDNTTNDILYTFDFSIPEDGEIVCTGPIKEFTAFIQYCLEYKDDVNEEVMRDMLSSQARTLPRSRYVDKNGFARIPQFIRGWYIHPEHHHLCVRYTID